MTQAQKIAIIATELHIKGILQALRDIGEAKRAIDESRKMLRKTLKQIPDDFLDKRTKQVLKMRFYDRQNIDKVAKDMGVTRERIRDIEARALVKLIAWQDAPAE